MAKDYVKRNKPAATKKAVKNKASAPTSSKLRLLPVFIVVAAIIGFVYFLVSIKDNVQEPSSNPSPVVQKRPTLVKPKPKSIEGDLPPKPKERSYIKELENKEVIIDLPEVDKKPSRPYLMQCGSFRHQSDAETLKAKIAFQGLEAIVRRSDGKKGVWHRVILGPFETKRKAEAVRHQLGRAKIRGCAIWYW